MVDASGPRTVGFVLAACHVIGVARIVIGLLIYPVDAQWQLLWLPFVVLDLPFSLVLLPLRLLCAGMSIDALPYPASQVSSFWLPAIGHGIGGSIWYYYLPQILVRDIRKILERFRSRGEGG